MYPYAFKAPINSSLLATGPVTLWVRPRHVVTTVRGVSLSIPCTILCNILLASYHPVHLGHTKEQLLLVVQNYVLSSWNDPVINLFYSL